MFWDGTSKFIPLFEPKIHLSFFTNNIASYSRQIFMGSFCDETQIVLVLMWFLCGFCGPSVVGDVSGLGGASGKLFEDEIARVNERYTEIMRVGGIKRNKELSPGECARLFRSFLSLSLSTSSPFSASWFYSPSLWVLSLSYFRTL